MYNLSITEHVQLPVVVVVVLVVVVVAGVVVAETVVETIVVVAGRVVSVSYTHLTLPTKRIV